MAARSADVARALNSLREFSSEDQQSLVEVIQDYFTFPDGSAGSDIEDELSEDDDDIEPASGITQRIKRTYKKLISLLLTNRYSPQGWQLGCTRK